MIVAAGEDVAQLLEVQEPEGQVQAVGADDFGQGAEGAAVFAVNVEHQDMGVLVGGERLLQHTGEGAGLAAAGGADDGEMLGEEIVGEQAGRDGGVLIEGADFKGGILDIGIDQSEVLAVGEIGVVADTGELRYAAAEGEARPVERELSDQQEIDDDFLAGGGGFDLKGGDHADDDGVLGEDLGETADLGAGGGAIDQFDLGNAAGDADDTAELYGCGARRGRLWRGASRHGWNGRGCGLRHRRGRTHGQRRRGDRWGLPDLVHG